MISRSSLKLGYLGSKTRSLGQIKGKPCLHFRCHISEAIKDVVYTLEVTCFKQSPRNLLRLFILMSLGQIWNLVSWGQKLGHQTKSKEKLVNTPEVTLLKQHHNLAQNVLSCWFLGLV